MDIIWRKKYSINVEATAYLPDEEMKLCKMNVELSSFLVVKKCTLNSKFYHFTSLKIKPACNIELVFYS